MTAHETAMNKAKIALMSRKDTAFFTSILFSMRLKWDGGIPTAATNGRELLVNPKFWVDKANPKQREFVLFHETMHVALDHIGRLTNKNTERWNVACDHIINLMAKERGYAMWDWVLCDPQYKGMSADEVYKLLPEDASMPKEGGQDIQPAEGDPAKFREHMDKVLVRAAMASKMGGDGIGTIPGSIQTYLDKLLNPKLPWHRILAKYMRAYAKTDYSMAKPNRRFFPKNHLPSMHGQAMMNLAVAADISASTNDAEFHEIISETAGIFKMFKPEELTLIQFDTTLQHVDSIKSMSELAKIQFHGRGGTDVGPVFEWAMKHKPQCLLIFTDGGFYFPDIRYSGDVVWLIYNNPNWTAPFGKIIHYDPVK